MFVMFHEPAPNFLPKARLHFPAHRARLEEFHGRGVLLGAGPLEDPRDGSSMGLFTTREAAEEFIKDDPFVVNGVVGRWRIREWADVFSS
jgi:uncharacterized protein YciI